MLQSQKHMTTSSFKVHGYDHPLPQDLSRKMSLPPRKPRIWQDRLRDRLVKKRHLESRRQRLQLAGSCFNYVSFHQGFQKPYGT